MARKIKVTRINFVNFLRYAFLIIPCRSYSRSTQCNFDFLLNFIAHFHFLICHFSRPESNFNIEVLLGGDLYVPPSEFQTFPGCNFGRFAYRCRNFVQRLVACCHLSSFMSLFLSRVACRNLP